MFIPAHSDGGAVGPEAHGVVETRTDGHDIGPAAHIALAMFIPAHSDNGTVGPEAHGVEIARTDGHDIGPAAYIALAEGIFAHSDNGAVGPEAHGVGVTRTDRIPHCALVPKLHTAGPGIGISTCFSKGDGGFGIATLGSKRFGLLIIRRRNDHLVAQKVSDPQQHQGYGGDDGYQFGGFLFLCFRIPASLFCGFLTG